jgi:hypothetical protein
VTVAKAGRKMKSGLREANGRAKRPTRDDQEANQLRVILSQPHRRGQDNPTDQKHASAFGRFCVRMKLREEIYTASEKFAALVRAWRSAKGVPTQIRIQGSGNGLGPSDEAVKAWGDRIASIEHGVLAKCDPRGYVAIRVMILDEVDGDPRFDEFSREAAFWLAVEMGDVSPRETPFS